MPNEIDAWAQTAGGLVAGGGIVAILIRKWLAQYLKAGLEVGAITAQTEVLDHMRATIKAMADDHAQIAKDLAAAQTQLRELLMRLTRVEAMLIRQHELLTRHGIAVPDDIADHVKIIGGSK